MRFWEEGGGLTLQEEETNPKCHCVIQTNRREYFDKVIAQFIVWLFGDNTSALTDQNQHFHTAAHSINVAQAKATF